MSTQTRNGWAFEYAIAQSLVTDLGIQWHPASGQNIIARHNKYLEINDDLRQEMQRATQKVTASPWVQKRLDGARYVGIGDDPRNGDVRDLRFYADYDGPVIQGISLKWNSDEWKGLRFGGDWSTRSGFRSPLSTSWFADIAAWKRNLPGCNTYAEARVLHGDYNLYGIILRMIYSEFSAMAREQYIADAIANYIFGNHSCLKIAAKSKGSKVLAGDYRHSPHKGRLLLTEEDARHIAFRFGGGWSLMGRLHNRGQLLSIGQMSMSWSIIGWGEQGGFQEL